MTCDVANVINADVWFRLGFQSQADLLAANWLTPAELYQYADDAAQALARKTALFLTHDTSIAVRAGTPTYALPAGHIFTEAAWLSSPGLPLIAASVTLTAAQINGMFDSPVLVIPGVPNMLIRVIGTTVNAIYGGGPVFAGGGGISIYYGNVSPPVSFASTNGCAPTLLTSLSANAVGGMSNALLTAPFTPSSIAIGAGVYVANRTAPFTGGAGSSMIVNCLYYLIPGVQ